MQNNNITKSIIFGLLIAVAGVIGILIALYSTECVTCEVSQNITQISFWPLTLAGLADSINPCAIAVLVILLEGLILIRKNIVKIGLAFVAGIFATYFILGIGLLSTLTFFQNSSIFHLIVGVLAIIVGILNIKDFFWYGKFVLMEIPKSWRPNIGTKIRKVSGIMTAFGIGSVVGLFELPCTGGPYLFAIGVLKTQSIVSSTVGWLIYYNLIFVLPLLLIILLVNYSYVKIEATEKWRKNNLRLLHLISGIILIGLGSWLVAINW